MLFEKFRQNVKNVKRGDNDTYIDVCKEAKLAVHYIQLRIKLTRLLLPIIVKTPLFFGGVDVGSVGALL